MLTFKQQNNLRDIRIYLDLAAKNGYSMVSVVELSRKGISAAAVNSLVKKGFLSIHVVDGCGEFVKLV